MNAVPDEAVEAAAKALEQLALDETFCYLPRPDFWESRARVMLAAAVPLIREQIAREIEAQLSAAPPSSERFVGDTALMLAAAIARGVQS